MYNFKTDDLYCHRCGEPLVQDDDFDGDVRVLHFHCSYCGAEYEVELPEDTSEYPFYENEDISMRLDKGETDIFNEKCINCGHQIYVGSNFMLSDYDEQTSEDDDKMNFCMNPCPHCGVSEVRWDISNNEMKVFPYWKENEMPKDNA